MVAEHPPVLEQTDRISPEDAEKSLLVNSLKVVRPLPRIGKLAYPFDKVAPGIDEVLPQELPREGLQGYPVGDFAKGADVVQSGFHRLVASQACPVDPDWWGGRIDYLLAVVVKGAGNKMKSPGSEKCLRYPDHVFVRIRDREYK